MFRSQLLWRLYAGFVAIICISTLIVGTLVSRQVLDNGMQEIHHSLAVRAELLAEIAKNSLHKPRKSVSDGRLQATLVQLGKSTQSRLTVITGDGVVIADSQEQPRKMDNHGQRPEIIDARSNGSATTSRFSDTLQQKMIYRALRVMDGKAMLGFVRVSLSVDTIDTKLAHLRWIVLFSAALSALAALLLGFFFAKRITTPLSSMTEVAEAISRGDYQQRIRLDRHDELGTLADAFNRMAISSEQRMNELTDDHNRLAMIFSGMVEGVVGVDQHQNIVHINQAAANLLSLSVSTAINKPFWEEVRTLEINQALEQALKTGGVVKTQMRSSFKLAQVVDIYVAALANDNGEITGAVIVLHDISELDQLERIRHDFVANASHELKTPITAIRGMAETILDDAMPAKLQTSFIEKIHAQSLRLSTLVSDLMVISRFENKHQEQYFQTFNFVDVIRRSVAESKLISQGKQLTLIEELPEGKVDVVGDAQAISQLVDNLLSNAIKYTPTDGQVFIGLSVNQQYAELSVRDTGIGISPQNQQRIFERFYRVDKSRSRELGGTGLGLSIVKNIAEQHGGSVSLDSQLGHGSTFIVRLPL